MRASQAVHSRENFGEHGSTALREHSVSLLNAEFPSCSSRCWSLPWGATGTLLQRLLGVGIRPRFLTSSVRQPRCVLHCSHLATAKQTMSTEPRLCLMSFYLSQGLLLYWRQTCEWNPAKTLYARMHLRVALANVSRPLHGRAVSLCTTGPRRKESMFALIGKAKNFRATCMMFVQPLHRLL